MATRLNAPEPDLADRPPLSMRALAARVEAVPPSGIRRFFDILATMDDVISLGVGEPDFDTPERIERVAVIPGSAFGPSGEGHVRACYATSYEHLEDALGRIGRFVERHRTGSRA